LLVGAEFYDEIWLLDLGKNEWRRIKLYPAVCIAGVPQASANVVHVPCSDDGGTSLCVKLPTLAGAALELVDSHIYLFGGWNQIDELNAHVYRIEIGMC
jgi:hypothetical protein